MVKQVVALWQIITLAMICNVVFQPLRGTSKGFGGFMCNKCDKPCNTPTCHHILFLQDQWFEV